MERLTMEEYRKMYDECKIHIIAYEDYDDEGNPIGKPIAKEQHS
ncbi:MAG: hypothetical protein ACOXZ0_06850 [Eubacteriales bacterium]|jgi:hypothetical protein